MSALLASARVRCLTLRRLRGSERLDHAAFVLPMANKINQPLRVDRIGSTVY